MILDFRIIMMMMMMMGLGSFRSGGKKENKEMEVRERTFTAVKTLRGTWYEMEE